MIEARRIVKRYRSGTGWLEVLRGITLAIPDGDCVAITGQSGAGKSTLLHLLAGLDRPTEGEVQWDGRSLAGMRETELARLRNEQVGIVFQFYHLVPELTALENVMLPGLIHRHDSRQELQERAMQSLREVGLAERSTHRPRQLSGGELQRVAIARALINRPKALLCDEPTGNLDSQTGQQVAALLMDIRRRLGTSLVLVTHEQALAQLAERWVVLRDGQIVSDTVNRPAERRVGAPTPT